jgi:RNA polymerase sigma-70 factor, ECF subfamily
MTDQPAVTQLLKNAQAGDRNALDQLLPLVYDELRKLAAYQLRRERVNHTLQPTALVHEAYLRLINQREVQWQDRAQFFGLAAQMMRRILVNHALAHKTEKRGGHETHVSLDEAISYAAEREVNLVLLDNALTRLADLDPDQCRIVEMRFFGGLTVEEVAEVMKVSTATIKREWRTAKAWLFEQINGVKV